MNFHVQVPSLLNMGLNSDVDSGVWWRFGGGVVVPQVDRWEVKRLSFSLSAFFFSYGVDERGTGCLSTFRHDEFQVQTKTTEAHFSDWRKVWTPSCPLCQIFSVDVFCHTKERERKSSTFWPSIALKVETVCNWTIERKLKTPGSAGISLIKQNLNRRCWLRNHKNVF